MKDIDENPYLECKSHLNICVNSVMLFTCSATNIMTILIKHVDV